MVAAGKNTFHCHSPLSGFPDTFTPKGPRTAGAEVIYAAFSSRVDHDAVPWISGWLRLARMQREGRQVTDR